MEKVFKRKCFSLSAVGLILAFILLAGCAGNGKASGEADASFYEGETVEFLVPFGAGGGTDTFARFVAPFFNKHVKGQPDVQTVNVPGGGSINGANEFVELKKSDGYNALVTSASTHAPYLLGDPAVKYDLKTLKPIMGLPTGGVVYSNPETGIGSAEDVKGNNKDLVYAGISATGLDLVTLLSFEVLEMDVQAILGYDGRGPSRVAFEQGESNIDYQTSSAYLTNVQPLVEEGKAQPLFSFGQLDENGEVVRDPAFPDLPSLKEFYEEAYGKAPSGEAWEAYKSFLGSSFTVQKVIWVQNDAPENAVELLREGAQKVIKDEEFKSEGEEVLGGYEPLVGDQLDQVISNMVETDKEVINWVTNYLEQNYDVKRLN